MGPVCDFLGEMPPLCNILFGMLPPLERVNDLQRRYGELVPAFVFVAAWISPASIGFLGKNMGDVLSHSMWLEFIMGHAATAFVVTAYVSRNKTSRVSATVVFGVIYAVMVIGFCFATGSFYPLIQFGVVFWGRLQLARTGSRDDFKMIHIFTAASRVFLLMITSGIAAVLPLPRLGATPDALPMSGDGILIENPHRTLAWGCIYFVASWYLYNKALPGLIPEFTVKIKRRLRLP